VVDKIPPGDETPGADDTAAARKAAIPKKKASPAKKPAANRGARSTEKKTAPTKKATAVEERTSVETPPQEGAIRRAAEFASAHRAVIVRSAVTVAIVLALLVAYLLPQVMLKPKVSPPEAMVRALIKDMKAGRGDTAHYESYFADLSVASAVADAVRRGSFPKGLDVSSVSAVTGDTSATVTVKWTMPRPAVKENGTVFMLRKKNGTGPWRILDATPVQVP
jgi:hypothetical protein